MNIMAVAHGMEKALVHEHKAAIDAHLTSVGIPVSYTNVFWGGRSEIKPSEILPSEYKAWCARMGVGQELFRAVTLAVDREVEDVARVGGVAQVAPQPRRTQKVSFRVL